MHTKEKTNSPTLYSKYLYNRKSASLPLPSSRLPFRQVYQNAIIYIIFVIPPKKKDHLPTYHVLEGEIRYGQRVCCYLNQKLYYFIKTSVKQKRKVAIINDIAIVIKVKAKKFQSLIQATVESVLLITDI